MSAISYRDWKLFVDSGAFGGAAIHGHYIVSFADLLMADQTIAHIAESCSLTLSSAHVVKRPQDSYGKPAERTADNQPMLRLIDYFDPAKASEAVQSIIELVERLSFCADFPLIVTRIEFLANGQEPLLHAVRRQIGRGVAFEVEERSASIEKFKGDMSQSVRGSKEQVALKFYMTGMKLLGLEDQVDGLIDAAFMQFYQGCEIFIGHDKLDRNCRWLATLSGNHSENLQVAWHQIYHIRNSFFGHGNAKTSIHGQTDPDVAHRAARQVLVVRWILRTLLDIHSTTKIELLRRMTLFSGGAAFNFNGALSDFDGRFWAPQVHDRTVRIYDVAGTMVRRHQISDKPL